MVGDHLRLKLGASGDWKDTEVRFVLDLNETLEVVNFTPHISVADRSAYNRPDDHN